MSRVLAAVIAAPAVAMNISSQPGKAVFTNSEVKECGPGGMRTNHLVRGSSDNAVWHILAKCKNDGSPDKAGIVMKTSTDHGKTWNGFQHLTGKGFGSHKAIFDEKKEQLVVQYIQKSNKNHFQVITKDHGKTWSKKANIQAVIKKACGGDVGGSGGGQRIQTNTGRLLWFSGNGGSPCIWYSDDHGATYKAKLLEAKSLHNEVSFAQLNNGNLFANGRGVLDAWKPHRIDYHSTDDGLTWKRSQSRLVDPVVGGESKPCEAGLASSGKLFYFSEPVGSGSCDRCHLKLRCSQDGGETWPHALEMNSGSDKAGYSTVQARGGTNLIVAWDVGVSGGADNVHVQTVSQDWCRDKDAVIV